LRRTAQLGLEAANAKPSQRRLHAVGNPGLLAHQAFALTAQALGVLRLKRWDRHHPAVSSLAAQPAQEHALEHGGIQPVGLGPAVLARHGDACRMDDVNPDAARLQPARQPEPVTSRLIGQGHHTCNSAA